MTAVPCPKGTFGNENQFYQSSQCKLCAIGSYANKNATIKCTTCPGSGKTRQAGSTASTDCPSQVLKYALIAVAVGAVAAGAAFTIAYKRGLSHAREIEEHGDILEDPLMGRR